MYCSNCGTQNPDGASFCTNCGANFSAAPISSTDVASTVNTFEAESMRKKATTAMILGIIACAIAWYPVLSIGGIIMGAIALSQVKKIKAYYASIMVQRPGTLVAAQITSLVGLIGGIVMTLFYLLYIVLIILVVVNAGDIPVFFENMDIDIPVAS